jgi:hypothetical protein
MSARLHLLAVAVAGLLLSAATPVAGQDLLNDIAPQGGVCTCAVMRPPNDCSSALAEPRAIANQRRGEIRAECAKRWRAGCEEQYGWQQCASAQASRQLDSDCNAYVEQWWGEVIAPQINEMSSQCNSANAQWIQHCETVERPQNCQTCEDMSNEIATLEKDIGEARAWIEGVRNGAELITADTEAEIAQRVDDIDRWESELADKQEGYKLLQDSEFCPA